MSTTAGIQALIDTGEVGKNVRILKEHAVGTTTSYYCQPIRDPKARSCWINVTNTDSDATNAAAILAALV